MLTAEGSWLFSLADFPNPLVFSPNTVGLRTSWEYRYSLCRKGYITSRVWFLIFIVLDVFVLCYLLGQWITEQSHRSCMVIILNFQNEAIIYLNSEFFADPEVPNSKQEIACFLSCLPACFLRKKLHSANFCEQQSCGPGLHFPRVLPAASKY